MKLIDGIRNLFGVRRVRLVRALGAKPRLGAKIVCGDVRMAVQAGLTDATWKWLAGLGWREEDHRRDRRRYRDVPPSVVAELFDARDADERAAAMDWAVTEANFRPEAKLDRH